jgi:predicted RNA-binding Zn-ribbon protein involved in translation (DUF1610 family)
MDLTEIVIKCPTCGHVTEFGYWRQGESGYIYICPACGAEDSRSNLEVILEVVNEIK